MEKLVGRTATITTEAAVKRINRALLPDHQQLHKTRGMRMISCAGLYHIMDHSRNFLMYDHVNVEKFGRKLGVIATWEDVE